jgi:hypothetical protein
MDIIEYFYSEYNTFKPYYDSFLQNNEHSNEQQHNKKLNNLNNFVLNIINSKNLQMHKNYNTIISSIQKVYKSNRTNEDKNRQISNIKLKYSIRKNSVN